MIKRILIIFIPLILVGGIGYYLQSSKGYDTQPLEYFLYTVIVVLNIRKGR